MNSRDLSFCYPRYVYNYTSGTLFFGCCCSGVGRHAPWYRFFHLSVRKKRLIRIHLSELDLDGPPDPISASAIASNNKPPMFPSHNFACLARSTHSYKHLRTNFFSHRSHQKKPRPIIPIIIPVMFPVVKNTCVWSSRKMLLLLQNNMYILYRRNTIVHNTT
jgi:hypothetical protein